MGETEVNIGAMLAGAQSKWTEGQEKKSYNPPNGEHTVIISKTNAKRIQDPQTKDTTTRISVIAQIVGGSPETDGREFVLVGAKLNSEWGMLNISKLAEFLAGGVVAFKSGADAWGVIEQAQAAGRSFVVQADRNPKNPQYNNYTYVGFADGQDPIAPPSACLESV